MGICLNNNTQTQHVLYRYLPQNWKLQGEVILYWGQYAIELGEIILGPILHKRGRDSESLRAGRSRDRIPVKATFSAPVQTGPGAHPASCIMNGYRVFPGGKGGQGVTLTTHPIQRWGHGRVELYLYSPSGPATGWNLANTSQTWYTRYDVLNFIVSSLVHVQWGRGGGSTNFQTLIHPSSEMRDFVKLIFISKVSYGTRL